MSLSVWRCFPLCPGPHAHAAAVRLHVGITLADLQGFRHASDLAPKWGEVQVTVTLPLGDVSLYALDRVHMPPLSDSCRNLP